MRLAGKDYFFNSTGKKTRAAAWRRVGMEEEEWSFREKEGARSRMIAGVAKGE